MSDCFIVSTPAHNLPESDPVIRMQNERKLGEKSRVEKRRRCFSVVQDPLFSLSSFCATFSLLLSPYNSSSTPQRSIQEQRKWRKGTVRSEQPSLYCHPFRFLSLFLALHPLFLEPTSPHHFCRCPATCKAAKSTLHRMQRRQPSHQHTKATLVCVFRSPCTFPGSLFCFPTFRHCHCT